MKKRSLSGSHPEEHYVPATRERMHLDKPTSHGGWPEGEYDPPVQDKIYGWYKKMKMMPEGDEHRMRDADTAEQRRDLQKGRHGGRMGYLEDQESLDLAPILAQQIAESPDPETSDAFTYVMKHPEHAMNVYLELYSLGKINLARMVRDSAKQRADEYVTQRGTDMRITESTLRRIVREEYGRLREADGDPVSLCKEFRNKKFGSESEMQSAKKKLASDLLAAGAKGEDAILDALDSAGYGNAAVSFASELAGMQSMKESQRGNDQNSQHDNDTDPGDPYAKKLKEARRRALKSAIMAEINRRRAR